MKKINEFKSRKEWEKNLWQELIKELSNQKTHGRLADKLGKLFSEHERDLAVKRLTALILIQEGLSYRDIGELLWMSPSTISVIRKNHRGDLKSYQGRTKSAKNPRRYSKLPEFKETVKSESFWEFIKSIRLQEGYSDPRKRWEFLKKW